MGNGMRYGHVYEDFEIQNIYLFISGQINNIHCSILQLARTASNIVVVVVVFEREVNHGVARNNRLNYIDC